MYIRYIPEGDNMYTIEDIVVTKAPYTTRKWYHGSNGNPSEFRYGKSTTALCFTTKDGKYTTGTPDSDGYSYWQSVSDGIRIGHTSTDYVFGCDAGLYGAVEKLNKIISK
jgi:hypothetical protein